MRHALALSICLAVAVPLHADVELPALFGDHMVIQRDLPVHVWGAADPGEPVTVTFREQEASTVAASNGQWEVYLAPVEAGGPHSLSVIGDNSIKFSDVLIGDVWVGSGQSNMVWPIQRSNDAEEEIAAANYPNLRYFKVELDAADERATDVKGEWRTVSPDTAAELSGVAYFFARHLHGELGVPFGIVQSAWGGTPAEAWTSDRTLSSEPTLAAMAEEFRSEAERDRPAFEARLKKWEAEAAKARADGKEVGRRPTPPRSLRAQQKPSALFNAMIAPLTPFAIRGVIWYQGENNGSRGQGLLYRRLFRSMIEDWRREWGLGPFPFLFVQLANYARVPEVATWPELREAQALALGLVNTGMAVTIDIGNSTDIHPRNKQDVGLRLALAARAIAYGERGLDYSGPAFRQATREGTALRLWFDHTSTGLSARGGPLKGFEVAGSDGEFVVADAKISGDTVLVSSTDVDMPVQARYAWAADPKGNLINAAGLPAGPFRTMD